jgi:uncharacterized membrane protein YfcA
MIQLLFFSVSLISTIIGGICGIGGGVIIKPVLDATGVMSVSNVSFLSGCTVLSMTLVSFIKNRLSKGVIEMKTCTVLAVGSMLGGLLGKMAFDLLKSKFYYENHLGAVQAGLLTIITLGTLLYTLFKQKIKTHYVENISICCLIGLILGMISAFLGIGGGPINLMVLSFFFSMDLKKAAANSLYIILFSQLASLLQTLVSRTVPPSGFDVLTLMILAGIFGGLIGSRINKKISNKGVAQLFIGVMAFMILINIYNFAKFMIT